MPTAQLWIGLWGFKALTCVAFEVELPIWCNFLRFFVSRYCTFGAILDLNATLNTIFWFLKKFPITVMQTIGELFAMINWVFCSCDRFGNRGSGQSSHTVRNQNANMSATVQRRSSRPRPFAVACGKSAKNSRVFSFEKPLHTQFSTIEKAVLIARAKCEFCPFP